MASAISGFFPFLFPRLPHIRAIADGGLPAVADDGRLQQGRIFEQPLDLVLLIGQVLHKRVVRRLGD